MQQTEIAIFVFTATVLALLFIGGIFLFLFIYHKRKVAHLKEKSSLNEAHSQAMLTTQLTTQQETMQHIGTEIHDSVAQKLTLASLYNKQLTVAAVPPSISIKMEAIGCIIDESLAELRQLSKTLTDPQLANADLLYLLREEASRINLSGICTVSIRNTGQPLSLPQEKKNLLFRILQEFMQNSLKHAACTAITILLHQQENMLIVSATDDGKGFDTALVSNGIGLQNMKNRALQMNASYRLTSKHGKGTMLNLAIQTE